MSENVLTIENATMQFGGVVAVDNLNLKVDKNQIVSLIGPNGAGKTTAFNVVTGVYAPTNGAVWFEGRKIIENTPHGKMKKLYKGQNAGTYSHIIAPTPDKITRMGIARTFQNIRLWKSQTVFENVLIAKHCRCSANLLSATFRLNADEEKRQREECEHLLQVLYGIKIRHTVYLIHFEKLFIPIVKIQNLRSAISAQYLKKQAWGFIFKKHIFLLSHLVYHNKCIITHGADKYDTR